MVFLVLLLLDHCASKLVVYKECNGIYNRLLVSSFIGSVTALGYKLWGGCFLGFSDTSSLYTLLDWWAVNCLYYYSLVR